MTTVMLLIFSNFHLNGYVVPKPRHDPRILLSNIMHAEESYFILNLNTLEMRKFSIVHNVTNNTKVITIIARLFILATMLLHATASRKWRQRN